MRRLVALAIPLLFAVLLIAPGISRSQPASSGRRRVPISMPSIGPSKPPPPPVETATNLTLFENPDLTGASYSVDLKPFTVSEATWVVTTSNVGAAGLYGKVSSARLTCGTRPSRAALFDIDWGEFSSGTMMECAANQVATINLATQGGSRDLNDKINAAALVAHVRSSDNGTHEIGSFSTIFNALWKTGLDTQLAKSGNATNQGTRTWIDDFHTLHVWQSLQISHSFCTSRGAVFELRIIMTDVAFRPAFQAQPISSYVDYGFGDAWGCHDGMLNSLNSSINDIAAQLPSQLGERIAQLLPNASSVSYYFAPEGATQDYDVFYSQ